MDLERTEVYSRQHRSQTDTYQSSNPLGKRERDAQACRVLNPACSTLTGKPSALAIEGSTSRSAGSTARLSNQVLGAGGRKEIHCPSRQAQGSTLIDLNHNIASYVYRAYIHRSISLLSIVLLWFLSNKLVIRPYLPGDYPPQVSGRK